MPIEVAGSNGYAEHLRKTRTPTENAVAATQRLDYLWEQIKEKERELAIYMRTPGFDKAEYDRQMKEYVRGKPL